jgi:hypothetical protein
MDVGPFLVSFRTKTSNTYASPIVHASMALVRAAYMCSVDALPFSWLRESSSSLSLLPGSVRLSGDSALSPLPWLPCPADRAGVVVTSGSDPGDDLHSQNNGIIDDGSALVVGPCCGAQQHVVSVSCTPVCRGCQSHYIQTIKEDSIT